MGDVREDRGLRREEVMRILGISRATFYRLIHGEQLSAYKINVGYRVKESELERFRRHRKTDSN